MTWKGDFCKAKKDGCKPTFYLCSPRDRMIIKKLRNVRRGKGSWELFERFQCHCINIESWLHTVGNPTGCTSEPVFHVYKHEIHTQKTGVRRLSRRNLPLRRPIYFHGPGYIFLGIQEHYLNSFLLQSMHAGSKEYCTQGKSSPVVINMQRFNVGSMGIPLYDNLANGPSTSSFSRTFSH